MSVVLYRVDERLIHGQVIVAWGGRLEPSRIIVVDDILAATPWEQELYAMGVPADMEAEFLSVAEARERLAGWQASPERIILLTRDIATMARLAEGGLMKGAEVNLGGIHHAPGRTRVLRYVFLSDEDRKALEELSGHGTSIVARDVPDARGVSLEDLVRAS